MFLFAEGMNGSLHSRDQQGDLSWVPEGWEHPSSLGELETRQNQGGRLEWDWESPQMLSQTTTGVAGGTCNGEADADAARKLNLLSSLLRPCYGLLPSSIGSQLPQDQIGLLASSGMQSLAGDIPSNMHTMPSAHAEFGLSSNFSGLGGSCFSQGDLRFDTRRHLLGIMGLDQKGLNDFVKPHDLYAAEAHGRIGLNLGVRTYFSTEDSLFGRLSKRARANSPGSQVPMCQAEGCKADLTIAKHYHRRHKVCELHSKAVQVITNGQNQRFCQQCSRFHPLSEFDEGKRSCRKRLADHNRRRRKPQPSSSATGGKTAEPLSVKTEEKDQTVADRADGKTTKSYEDNHAHVIRKDPSSPPTSMEKSENLQVLTISKEDCSQTTDKTSSRTSLLSTLSSSLSRSDSSQALLSAIPVSSPVSFMLKDHSKGQLTGSAEASRDAVYQHFLQGMSRNHLGPSLSLSSSTSMSEGGHYLQPQALSMSQSYSSGIDNTLPWLKAMELKPSIDYSSNQDQSMCLDRAQLRHVLATSIAGASSSQLLPPSIHNLLPLESPRVIETSDWMLGSISGQKREHSSGMESSSTLPNSCGLEPRHMQLAPLETAALSDESTVQVTRAPIMNFLQQKPIMNSSQSDETDSTDEELSKLRFSELNVLRSFEPIYDSPSSFL
ncbi:hypothetical protein O6H91_06G088100 [Diphasiastrum complanatum]|uniref:Uncharacterized protein n=1 Tax=Diphasiastrum complanatum TaxID=34168 RepID=A0ACC2DG93_DIPCM|nr:hypothetical protein O6H91_06G088100 [Diphasiastrum complanatum]